MRGYTGSGSIGDILFAMVRMLFTGNAMTRRRLSRSIFILLLAAFFGCYPHCVSAQTAGTTAAAKPLYRDPVHDGAADPSLVYDRANKRWLMFYTNRRADLSPASPHDVAWVHGTAIGIAESRDGGTTWKYAGTADIPYGKPGYTFWAPDMLWNNGTYHMFLTVVPGTFSDWNHPREIIHLTSKDLQHWTFEAKLPLTSDRTIDPDVLRLGNGEWRLFYKDERDHSYIHYATSTDLYHWKDGGVAISDRPSEGPVAFRWKGAYWLIVDAWDGLGVYRSNDGLTWTAQSQNLLADEGEFPTDRSKGHHADVVVSGDRAYLFYFVHQEGKDLNPSLTSPGHRTVIQVVELLESAGILTADRNQPTVVSLQPPQ
jgi:sucrose-6-phosphate hydrolase SacC (GH32 family)